MDYILLDAYATTKAKKHWMRAIIGICSESGKEYTTSVPGTQVSQQAINNGTVTPISQSPRKERHSAPKS